MRAGDLRRPANLGVTVGKLSDSVFRAHDRCCKSGAANEFERARQLAALIFGFYIAAPSFCALAGVCLIRERASGGSHVGERAKTVVANLRSRSQVAPICARAARSIETSLGETSCAEQRASERLLS